MPQAYDGIRILDFSQVVSGPYAAQLMGNQGAEVIKVEPARGDQLRQIFKTSPPSRRTPIRRPTSWSTGASGRSRST